MTVRLIGDDLIEVLTPSSQIAVSAAHYLRRIKGVEEAVPAMDRVTLQFDPLQLNVEQAMHHASLSLETQTDHSTQVGQVLTIPVHYGGAEGPDLEDVAASSEMSTDEFIALHAGKEYPVAMIGFMPGFAYLSGLDARVTIGRKGQPRPKVPAGSVAVIEGFTGVYPLSAPGGWQIIGRTSMTLFEAKAEHPFRLQQGMSVRFEVT